MQINTAAAAERTPSTQRDLKVIRIIKGGLNGAPDSRKDNKGNLYVVHRIKNNVEEKEKKKKNRVKMGGNR